ncbi:MAG: outer membrane beta-barrel protein [Bdellovibrionales bacterium]
MKNILVLFFAAFFSLPAHADILIEPFAGYSIGTISYKTADTVVPAGATDSGTLNGLTYGAHVAYVFPTRISLGAAYEINSGTKKWSRSNADTDVSQSTLYAMGGFYAPLGLRAYAGYGLKTEEKDTISGATTSYTGTAIKLGVGYEFLLMFAFNLEYVMYDLKNLSASGTDMPVTDLFSEYKYSAVRLVLSVPIQL